MTFSFFEIQVFWYGEYTHHDDEVDFESSELIFSNFFFLFFGRKVLIADTPYSDEKGDICEEQNVSAYHS